MSDAVEVKLSDHTAFAQELWPPADRAAWQAALREADFLVDAGRGAKWRPASRRSAEGAYGRLLQWMSFQGIDLAAEAPAARVTPERMRSYADFLIVRSAPVTVASTLAILCMALRAMFPLSDWSWLSKAQSRARRRARPSRNIADHIVPVQELVRLGLGLMEVAQAQLDLTGAINEDRRRVVAAARDYRDGLLIALLALRPVRLKNLLMIELGRHLVERSGTLSLSFTAAEMKTGRPYAKAWPEMLIGPLDRYCRDVRPALISAVASRNPNHPLRSAGAFLWIAQGGTPLTEGALQKLLKRHTLPRLGRVVTAQRFRHSAASTGANEDPDNVALIADLLGHTNLRTTERAYIVPAGNAAEVSYHELLAQLRWPSRSPRS